MPKADAVLEIGNAFLTEKIRATVTKAAPRPTTAPPTGPATGARLERIYLEKTGPSQGMITVELKSLIYDGPNLENEIPVFSFYLRLLMTPSLSGKDLLLNLAFVDLRAGDIIAYADKGLIECGKGHNELTAPILELLLPALSADLKPIPIGLDLFDNVLNALVEPAPAADAPSRVTQAGLAVVRDGFTGVRDGIRIGVTVPGGFDNSPGRLGDPFDSGEQLNLVREHRANIDWSLELAYDQLREKVVASVGTEVEKLKKSSPVSLPIRFLPDQTTLEPLQDHYRINAAVRVDFFCGGFTVIGAIDLRLTVGDARSSPGGGVPDPVIQQSRSDPVVSTDAPLTQRGCIAATGIFALLAKMLVDLVAGFGTGTIGPGPPTQCSDVLIGGNNSLAKPLDGDLLYVTETSAYPNLAIGGRSQTVDVAKPGRPAVPPCRR